MKIILSSAGGMEGSQLASRTALIGKMVYYCTLFDSVMDNSLYCSQVVNGFSFS